MTNFLKNKINTYFGLAILIPIFVGAILIIWIKYIFSDIDYEISFPDKPLPSISPFSEEVSLPVSVSKIKGIKKFTSETEFKNYLIKGREISGYYFFDRGLVRTETIFSPLFGAPMDTKREILPERVSETNVQVLGIDEPDILKTDGKNIYFSSDKSWPIWREPIIMEKRIMPPYRRELETKIIKAFPPADLEKISKIESSGNLLLIKDKNILTIFSEEKIVGYSVSDPEKPEKKWEIKLNRSNSIVTSRLYKNKIYLITKNYIDEIYPCPIKPIIVGEKEIEIACSEIYYPSQVIPADVTFLAMMIDPLSGQIEKKISFIGSSGQSVVYMSENALYISYTFYESFFKFISQFFKTECQDLIPVWVVEKLEKLESYDISQQTKFLEFQLNLEKYYNSLDDDEKLRIVNEVENRMLNYYKEKMRELEKSGIVKITLEDLQIKNVGQVPGFPLNQFALDEYQENLRIAITIGERFDFFGNFGTQRNSANDIYVLDKNLNILGSVKDLGLTERIYSARFIEDKGYLVTFRQIDPFYVVDLSNPQKPELKGELKIPGYSAYLHPISKDKILGIGKEDWQVKVSLFDVSKPDQPKEIDKYILKEGWSDILNTHHAFLLDQKHQIFFLPGSSGGYIFSWTKDKLSLIKAVSQISAKRAIYLDDYLYIIGENKIIVINQTNWEKIKELEI